MSDTEKKPRKARTAPEGKPIKFHISDEHYAVLKEAAEKDYRTPEQLAMVVAIKHAKELQAGSNKTLNSGAPASSAPTRSSV